MDCRIRLNKKIPGMHAGPFQALGGVIGLLFPLAPGDPVILEARETAQPLRLHLGA